MVHRRYFVAWLGLLTVDVANGSLRVATYGKTMSELADEPQRSGWQSGSLSAHGHPHRIVKRWQLGWSRRGVK